MQTSLPLSFDSTMEQALQASQANDNDTAIALFGAAAQLEPSSPIPHFLMAAEYMELAQVPQAEAAYASALLLNPAFHIARFQLGLLFLTSERNAMALITWEALLSLDEKNSLRLFVEGFAAMLGNELDHAIVRIEQGILHNQENPPLNLDMQRILQNLLLQKEQSTDQAVEEVLQTTAAESETPPVEETSIEDANHFLLNNYQQKGSLH